MDGVDKSDTLEKGDEPRLDELGLSRRFRRLRETGMSRMLSIVLDMVE